MTVTVHVHENYKDVIEGTITWDGTRYILNPPDSLMLKRMVSEPARTGNAVFLPSDGDRFLHALHIQNQSAYSWVSEPK